MKPFEKITSNICPIDIPNIDTDQIIPKQFLKRIERTGFGQFLFYDWRYNENEKENPEFNLNKPEYRNAKILLAEDNFGCGSSREHAPWALEDYGYKVIISPSFADIFYNNCFQNGILPIRLPKETVNQLFQAAFEYPEETYTVDLINTEILVHGSNSTSILGEKISFEIDESKKEKLLKGLDDIGWTMQFLPEIEKYEESIVKF